MKLVRLLLVSILLAFSWSGVIHACSCAPFSERAAAGGIVVSGTIEADVEAGVVSPWGSYSTRLVAETVWFGPDRKTFRLIAPPRMADMCGSPYAGKPGERMLVWLHPFGGDFYTIGPCSLLRWEDPRRPAIEEKLRAAAAAYYDVDRWLRARPDDADLWRRRLKIATSLEDAHGRLRSLQRLIDLTPAPTIDLLKDAATTANAVRDDAATARYLDRALTLEPADVRLSELRKQAKLRQAYDKAILPTMQAFGPAMSRGLPGTIWTDQRDDNARLDHLQFFTFQIQRSTFGGVIRQSTLDSGIIRDTSLVGMKIRDSEFSGLLMRNVDLSRATLSRSKIEGAHIADTTFRDAEMSNVSLVADLDRVDFKRARLTNVRFWGELKDVDFAGASLERVEFLRAQLRNVDFRLAYLRGTDLSRASLMLPSSGEDLFRGAKYDLRTKWPATYQGADGKELPFDPAEHGAILVTD